MNAESSVTRTSWRRPSVRMSLRTLILLVLVSGAGIGWIAYRIRTERQAVAAAVKAGGHLGFDFQQTTTGQWDLNVKSPPIPGILLRHFPRERFEDVTYLSLRGPRIGDAHLRQVSALSHLEYLDLGNVQVTDAGLAHIRLGDMKHLFVDGTQVTDTTLKRLARSKRLRTLCVTGSKVTDAGVAELQRALPNAEIVR